MSTPWNNSPYSMPSSSASRHPNDGYIESLRQTFGNNWKEIAPKVRGQITIQLPASRQLITITVEFPSNFPQIPPTLWVAPTQRSPVVSPQGMIMPTAHPNLQKWTPNCNLGAVVREIVDIFVKMDAQASATQFGGQANNNSNNSNNPYGSLSGASSSSSLQYPPPSMQTQPDTSHIPLPQIPSSFPELERKSVEELNNLLKSEDALSNFLESLSIVTTTKNLNQDIQKNLETTSEKLNQKQKELETLKQELSKIEMQFNERRQNFEIASQKQQEVQKQFTGQALIYKLAEGAREAENISDDIANDFLGGSLDARTFIQKFQEKRQLFHLRSAKKESLVMMLK